MQHDISHYQDFDMATADIIKHPKIAKLQANKHKAERGLDDDVLNWLYQQNADTKKHINNMIREAMALQSSAL